MRNKFEIYQEAVQNVINGRKDYDVIQRYQKEYCISDQLDLKFIK